MMNKKSSSRKFNELVKSLESKKVEAIDIKEPKVRHPYFIMPSWQEYDPDKPEKAVCVFTLEPAFCSAKDVRVSTKGKYCSKITEDRLGKGELKKEEFYEAYLSERPKVMVSWRQIGGDADTPIEGIKTTAEKVPDIFLKMGVTAGGSQKSTFTDQKRKLFVTDIWLQSDRWVTDVDITIADPFSTASVAQYDIKYGYPPQYSKFAKIYSGGPFKPSSSPRGVLEKLLGVTPEAWDALLVGKLYAVSPPADQKEVFAEKPTPAYQLIEEQMLFWNVNYLAPELAPLPQKVNLRLNTGLLGGMADAIFNTMLAFVNDTTNMALTALVALEKRKGKYFSI